MAAGLTGGRSIRIRPGGALPLQAHDSPERAPDRARTGIAVQVGPAIGHRMGIPPKPSADPELP